MALRRWLDQLLRRGTAARSDGAAVTASSRKQADEERAPATVDEVEEGMHAARDEVSRDTRMPPPGTS